MNPTLNLAALLAVAGGLAIAAPVAAAPKHHGTHAAGKASPCSANPCSAKASPCSANPCNAKASPCSANPCSAKANPCSAKPKA